MTAAKALEKPALRSTSGADLSFRIVVGVITFFPS